MLLADGHQLVGALVDGDQTGFSRASAQVQFRHTSHVAALAQVLLVLLGEDMPEVRAFQLRLLAYTVDAEPDLSVLHGYQ